MFYIILVVFQDAVLGPSLFILYINDRCSMTNILKFVVFADDTTILCSVEDIKQFLKVVIKEIDRLKF